MTEITMSDLLAQETKRTPHIFYAQLRSTEPMIYVEGLNAWLLTTYEKVASAITDYSSSTSILSRSCKRRR